MAWDVEGRELIPNWFILRFVDGSVQGERLVGGLVMEVAEEFARILDRKIAGAVHFVMFDDV